MKKILLSGVLVICGISFAGCASSACDQAQKFRWKAMQASNESEKRYYEGQARLYDENCARDNNSKYEQEKDRQMRCRGK